MLFVHVATGVPSIFLGAAALLLRPDGIRSPRHRWTGRSYLLAGSANAAAGLALSLSHPHGSPGLYIATGTVALAWLLFAAMAYRATMNGRLAAHRDWAIRTYVLTWTFVGCRIAQGLPMLPGLGSDGITALVWLNWVVPLILTQLALEWRRGAKSRDRSGGTDGRPPANVDTRPS